MTDTHNSKRPLKDQYQDLCLSVVDGRSTIGSLREKARKAVEKAGRAAVAGYLDPNASGAQAAMAKKMATASKRFTEWEIEALDPIARRAMARHLTGDQIEASAEHRAFLSALTQNIVLEARAGSGKTTGIVMKVDMLINDLGMDPDQIQILAFNRSAVRNLMAQLASCLKPEDAARVRVNTFHSLAFRILRASGIPSEKIRFYSEGASSVSDDFDDDAEDRNQLSSAAGRIATQHCRKVGRDAFVRRYNDLGQDFWTKQDGFGEICRDAVAKAATLYREQGGQAYLGSHVIAQAIAATAEQIDAELAARGEYDGNRGFRRAAELLTSADMQPSDAIGGVFGNLRFLFVDEAQDYTPAYNAMVSALVARNPQCTLNAVGDAWQSINGYTGADPEFFDRFETAFPFTVRLHLTTNLRSAGSVVALGNAIMTGVSGKPATPRNGAPAGVVRFHRGRNPEQKRGSRDEAAADLERLVTGVIDKLWKTDRMNGKEPGEIMLLSERNRLHKRDILSFAGPHCREDQVQATTVFKAKGGGWDHVILLDADDSNFPYNHPSDPIACMVTPLDVQRAEARRKLYVAATRAKRTFHALSASGTRHPALSTITIYKV